MFAGSRYRLTGVAALSVLVSAALSGTAVGSEASAPPGFGWLKPAPAPPGWKLLVPSSGTSLLWYPPWMRPVAGDPYSVSTALRNSAGTYLVYLNAGPRTGAEELSTWPTFRIEHLREERNRSVHEDGHGFGLPFRGGTGTCVTDDYVTRVAANHYREIACIVQGKTSLSVIVAAALAGDWPRYGPELERAVRAWQVR